METKKFYVTTPIYYVTAKPHLGSLYSTLLADVAARWHQLKGCQTFLLTGTDEHGQKVAQAAEKVGMPPKAFVDSFIDAYKHTWFNYEIGYNAFIRTTDEHHVRAVQTWIQKLIDTGDIYKAFYQGWYCTPCETFVTEKEALEALSADTTPRCPTCHRPTQWVDEETYFFRLSAYQDRLLAFYEEHPQFMVPKERMHEVINFVKGGLRDLSISRTTITWGIPFPNDSKHVTYVWADALNNYITAIGYGQPEKEEAFNVWWPADLQVLGKDIVRFHAIYWPAFLMASGLPLPKRLLVHGWITVDDQKMSKSFGNVVDPQQLCELYGAEPVRFYLTRHMSVTQDSNFSIADLEHRIASDLANDLGNLLNRMATLAHRAGMYEISAPVLWSPAALELLDASWNAVTEVRTHMDDCLFHLAYARLWKFINQVNAYFQVQEPWKLVKQNPQQFIEIIAATCQSLRTIALLLWPVMPTKMEELLISIGAQVDFKNDTIEKLELGRWSATFMIQKPENPLFTKPVSTTDASTDTAANKELSAVQPAAVESARPMMPDSAITIDDVSKVELRVGTIERCEILEQSDKLLKMQVNFGAHGTRQILAGVRKWYKAEELLGKQGVFVFNLKERAMVGTQSQGMMLFAEREDGSLTMATVADSVPNGARLR